VVVLVDLMVILAEADLLEMLVVLVVAAEHKTTSLVVKLNLVVQEQTIQDQLSKVILVVEVGDTYLLKVAAAVVVPVKLDLLDLVVQREVTDYRFQQHLEILLHTLIPIISGILLVVELVSEVQGLLLVEKVEEVPHQMLVAVTHHLMLQME
tara:strand:+ start:595 stop:1050 length:456 start_codon:yes stop_codon:yes gene_type:complete